MILTTRHVPMEGISYAVSRPLVLSPTNRGAIAQWVGQLWQQVQGILLSLLDSPVRAYSLSVEAQCLLDLCAVLGELERRQHLIHGALVVQTLVRQNGRLVLSVKTVLAVHEINRLLRGHRATSDGLLEYARLWNGTMVNPCHGGLCGQRHRSAKKVQGSERHKRCSI